jgi:hypothetical protein
MVVFKFILVSGYCFLGTLDGDEACGNFQKYPVGILFAKSHGFFVEITLCRVLVRFNSGHFLD